MTDYSLLCEELKSLSSGVKWDITILSNASALIWSSLDNLNWAGFYLFRNGELELGPFQGKVACTNIKIGRGVCGTAATEDRTLVVPDVHKFPTHIACDSASNSEIVIPVHKDGKLYGVLDIDSPLFSRFDPSDKAGLESFVKTLEGVL